MVQAIDLKQCSKNNLPYCTTIPVPGYTSAKFGLSVTSFDAGYNTYMYASPWCRCGPYAGGILLGMLWYERHDKHRRAASEKRKEEDLMYLNGTHATTSTLDASTHSNVNANVDGVGTASVHDPAHTVSAPGRPVGGHGVNGVVARNAFYLACGAGMVLVVLLPWWGVIKVGERMGLTFLSIE